MYTNIRRILISLAFLCAFFPAVAQVKITGTIMDQSNQPLPGVSVTIKGTTQGTLSGMNGEFSINADEGQTLVFSFLGYKDQSIVVSASSTNLFIVMEEEIIELAEVVAIGYGTVRKADVTSAVATVKAEDFLPGKTQDAAELIKGKVAGLSITKSSGDPNATSTILLRGISSIYSSFTPLILIDGIPGELTTVAPENIESIDVLKDASAAAIYGTRGANGVIIITTKTGQRQQPITAVYSSYFSASTFMKEAEFMTVDDIIAGKTVFPFRGYETDWVNAVTRTGLTQNHSLNLSGGTEKMAYSGNISYRNEAGTIKRSDNEELKMQMDIKQYMFNDKLKINLNILKGLHENSANNTGETNWNNIYRQAVIRNPSEPIYDENGDYYEDFNRFQYYNPVAMLNELEGTKSKEWSHLTGNITLEPVKSWETNLMLSTQQANIIESRYTTPDYWSNRLNEIQGVASKDYDREISNILELTSRYELTALNKHRASLMCGYSYTYEAYDGFNASNSDFPNNAYLYNNLEAGSYLQDGEAGMDSYKNDSRLIAFFGRATYNYDNKYNIMTSLRREGSSKFGEDHRWGWFPSLSTAWTMSNEDFMSGLTWLDHLKLRAGYGVTGKFPDDPYQSLLTFQFDNAYGNYLSTDGNWLPGLQVNQNENSLLHWEKTSEINIGLDFSLIKNRIGGSINLYNKETDDMLFLYTVPVPPNLNIETMANAASIGNKGIEILLEGVPVKKGKFLWNSTLTFSHNKNKLLSLSNDLYKTEDTKDVGWLGDPVSAPTHRWEVGTNLDNFWGLRAVSVTEDGYWIIEHPETGRTEIYTNISDREEYRQYLGNGLPKYYLGLNNTLRYGAFDLGVQMSGQFGFKILNQQRLFYENNYIQYNKLVSASDPVFGIAPLSRSQSQVFVDYYLEKGDFVKFDNVTFGYTLKLNERTQYMKSLRLYFSGQNLFCITGYKGLDPEIGQGSIEELGNDPRDKYPTIRSFTFGLNANF
ncbi:MAG: SusC/RagA family TonB-linked outer membrane protein [Bacteroidales bacterium]|nr:SusC/RagA family TonB-linked outer membrane protein [Bacteroidales bacterium]